MKATVVYYEGDPSGYALIVNQDEPYTADLVVFPEGGGSPEYRLGVPRRDEGGGHTWRPSKD
jgi:hypothetical protein